MKPAGRQLILRHLLMNFLLLVIDSLRADRLSCYGYRRPTTPNLDALAAAGVLFENFFTPVTPTQPAITTLFTGQTPLTHRIFAQSGRNHLRADAPWLPELLASHGYATAAIDNLALGKKWFRRGFRDYHAMADLESGEARHLRCTDFNREAAAWLKEHAAEPFFLYLRYGDPHTPYAAPAPYADLFYEGDPTVRNSGSLDAFYAQPLKSYLVEDWLAPAAQAIDGAAGRRIEDIEWCRAQYDAEVRFADDGVAELLRHLESAGVAENTAVIVVGDHGESLGEHGIYFEHHGLYDCTIRPPLIIRWPAGTTNTRRVAAATQLSDIAPTILEMAGLPIPDAFEGSSLVPLMRGETRRHVYEQIVCCEATWMCKWAWIENGRKLIIAREPDIYGKPPLELYDLNSDPREETNLVTADADLAREMLGRFEHWLAQQLAKTGETADPLREHGSVRAQLLRPPSLRKKFSRSVKRWCRKVWS
ncbi:MAG TPA: sulfatase [Chthoniobacterales bacterium]